MHPMLQLTIVSGVIAILLAIFILVIPTRWRKATLVLCLMVIFYMTLWRGNYDDHQINITPLWSYRLWSQADIRWQIYMNIFLFMPFGSLLKSLNFKHPVLIAFLTSIFVEFTQYVFALGLCETDDVINNTLGSAIGCGLFVFSDTVLRKHVWDKLSFIKERKEW